MATISENLQTIKSSIDAIKQAIIDKGGTVSGDITTWASAISGISGGGSSSEEEYVFTGTLSYNMTKVIITGYLNKIPDTVGNWLLALGRNPGELCYAFNFISNAGPYTLTVDFGEPIAGDEIPAICILSLDVDTYTYTIIPVKFEKEIATDPT
jgi:hypothetical protein